MTESDTKRQILGAALELFSQYGFSAVSIRDICGKVGIKCSSVYYHFRNKQAILDELTGRFVRLSESMPGPGREETDSDWPATAESLACATRSYFARYFLDGEMLKFQRAMSIEQHCNDKIAELYRSLVFDRPLAFHARLVGAAVRRGLLCRSRISRSRITRPSCSSTSATVSPARWPRAAENRSGACSTGTSVFFSNSTGTIGNR